MFTVLEFVDIVARPQWLRMYCGILDANGVTIFAGINEHIAIVESIRLPRVKVPNKSCMEYYISLSAKNKWNRKMMIDKQRVFIISGMYKLGERNEMIGLPRTHTSLHSSIINSTSRR